MNILIVDDEVIFTEYLSQVIANYFPFAQLHVVHSGTAAMKLINDYKFDIALLDILLGGMTGLELAEKILKESAETDIIMISAFQDFEYARQSIQLKVKDYLVKPIIESELINLLSQYVNEVIPHSKNYHAIVNEVISYVRNNYKQEIKLSELAQSLFVSPPYLSNLFKEQTGTTLSEYIMKYRIEKSKKLLLEGEKSIGAISEEVGFNSQNYYNRVFKKYEKMTPQDYRSQN
ncbi:hypothetical protein A0U40_15005 [[Bacillus] sp. KCTC 13219]|uniref:response regulator transcription factor n=1 Tax=Metasolibacillus fluoroglycofenilyticus TaxID=1239396 RepID=UPI00079BBFB0|nr:helix-turn-helix domain-containing protein [Metasolibacillus fluoroglycofenilyticus]KYG91269.1 hypothetical protein A0U40_15005 [[Bacillus] sp. KCTC 13219]